MSEKISKGIFIAEYLIIILPLAMVLLLATLIQSYLMFEYFSWSNSSLTFFAYLACMTIIAGYVIANNFILHGTRGLHTVKTKWWTMSFIGVTLVLVAGISKFIPASPEYSFSAIFRDDFELFSSGFPIFIPFAHLLLEKYLRKL